MRKTLVLSVLMLVVFGLAAISNAAINYNNGAPTIDNGHGIGSSATADDFAIASGGTVRSVGFYFQNYNGITGWDQQVTYSFLADSAGAPGGVLASSSAQNVTPTLSSYPWCCGGGNAWLVEFDLASDFLAAPGTTYWLQLTGAGGPNPWWVTASAAGAGNGRTDGYTNGYEFAFYLSDSNIGQIQNVPEPATIIFLGLGLMGLIGVRRSKI